MKEFQLLAIIICVLQSLDFVETICTHPFGTGTYISSTRGTWTTTDTTIANYKITVGTLKTTITLTCYNQNDSNRYIFFNYFQIFNNEYLYIYTCLDIRNSTYSDKYYFYEATELDISNSGDYFTADSTNVCNRVNYLTAVETKVVIKKDTYDTNKIYCPNIILGNYTYNTTDDYSDMDSCNNTQQLTFKKNKATYVALSSGGNLKCMYSGTGTYVYLIMFNIDVSVDNLNTYQFTCFAFSFSGYGSVVYASQRPQSCSSSQTPTSADSTAGKTFIFTPYVTCPIIETSTESKAAEDVAIISSSQTPTSADSTAGKTSIFTPYVLAAEDVAIISSSQTPTSADSTAGKTSIFTPYVTFPIIETSTESKAAEDVAIISSSQMPTSADSTAGKTSIFTPYVTFPTFETSTESKAAEDLGFGAGLVAIIVLVIITVIVIACFIFKKNKFSDSEPIIKHEEGRDGTPTPSPPPSLDRSMTQFDFGIETPSVQSFKGQDDKVEDKNVGGGEPLLEEDKVINWISGEPLLEDKEVINSIRRDTLPEEKEVAEMRSGEPILEDGDDKLKEDIEVKSITGDVISQDNILEPGKRINEEVEEEEIPTPDRRLQHDNLMHNSGSNTGNNTNQA